MASAVLSVQARCRRAREIRPKDPPRCGQALGCGGHGWRVRCPRWWTALMPIQSREPARRALGVSVPCQVQANRLPRPPLPANALPTLPTHPEVAPLAAHPVLPCQGPGPAERPPAGLLQPKASVHRLRAGGRGSASKPLPLRPPPTSDLPLPVPRGRQRSEGGREGETLSNGHSGPALGLDLPTKDASSWVLCGGEAVRGKGRGQQPPPGSTGAQRCGSSSAASCRNRAAPSSCRRPMSTRAGPESCARSGVQGQPASTHGGQGRRTRRASSSPGWTGNGQPGSGRRADGRKQGGVCVGVCARRV